MARQVRAYQQVLRSLPRSVRINKVSVGAEMLYVRLLLLADAEGRYWGSTFRVAALVLAERVEANQVTVAQVEVWLDELHAAGLTEPYVVDGVRYLFIARYHRAADNRGSVVFPAPAESSVPGDSDVPRPGTNPSPVSVNGRGDNLDAVVPDPGGEKEKEKETETETETVPRVGVVGDLASQFADWAVKAGVLPRKRFEVERHALALLQEAVAAGIEAEDALAGLMRLGAECASEAAIGRAERGARAVGGLLRLMVLGDGVTDLAGRFRQALGKHRAARAPGEA